MDSLSKNMEDLAQVGARCLTGGGTEFVVWATGKTKVTLWYTDSNDFSQFKPDVRTVTLNELRAADWKSVELNNCGNYWNVVVPEVGDSWLYLYELQFIDGSKLLQPDPGSWSQPLGVHGPSQVVSADFSWQDQDWEGVEWEDLVIYQVHSALFSPDGTLAGIRQRIPYLKDLGVSLLYCLPIMQFPGLRNLGYDSAYPRAVHNTLGGIRSAQALVNELHKAGIAAAFDCHEQNHLGPEGSYLWNFGPYFTDVYDTPWGSAKNNDQDGAEGQRRSLIETIRFYFKVLHADVLRMDACHQVYDTSEYHILHELQDEVNRLSVELGRPLYLLAETDADDGLLISSPVNGGFGWRGQLYDGVHHAVRKFVVPDSEGYFLDYQASEQFPLGKLAEVIARGYGRHYSVHHEEVVGKDLDPNLPFNKLVFPISNHDQVANYFGKRIAQIMDYETLKAYLALGLLLPSPPFIFFGDEFACEDPFYFFTDFSDPGVIDGVRNGRLEEFSYFYEDLSEFPDPQSYATFARSRPHYDGLTERQERVRAMVKYCLALRKSLPAISCQRRSAQEVQQFENQALLLYRRYVGDQEVVLVLNLGDEQANVQLAEEAVEYSLYLDTAEEFQGETVLVTDYVTVAPRSLMLLGRKLI